MTTSFTVRDALKLKVFAEAELLAGAGGLDHVITSVSVVEVLHATSYYRGGELQISALYSAANDIDSQLQVIRNLSTYGCAGLVLCHLGFWLKDISPRLLDLANELDFPIIKAPPQTAYFEIIMAVTDCILQLQNQNLTYSLNVHDQMSAVILQGNDAPDLLFALEHLVKRPVMLFDPRGEIITCNHSRYNQDVLHAIQSFLIQKKDMILLSAENLYLPNPVKEEERILLTPVISDDSYYGHLVVLNADDLGDMDYIALTQSKTALAIISMRKIRWEENLRTMKKEFLYDLITINFKDAEDIKEKGANLGYSIERIKVVMLVDILAFNQVKENLTEQEIHKIKQSFMRIVQGEVNQYGFQSPLLNYSDKLAIFFSPQKNEDERAIFASVHHLAEDIIRQVAQDLNQKVFIGIGDLCDTPLDIKKSHEQAVRATFVGKAIYQEPSYIDYRSLGIYNDFYDLALKPEGCAWGSQMFEPLKEYDKGNSGSLTETFKMLLKNNLDTMATAKALYVHKNTVLHRKNKIIKVLNKDPFVDPYLLQYQIALLLEKFNQK